MTFFPGKANFIRRAQLRLPSKEIERHTTWLEIFFDLIFAVILIQISDRLFHHLTYSEIFLSSALFIPIMWTWASYTVFAARFDNNDIMHWISTFIIMFAGMIMAIQIPNALEKGTFGFAVGFLIGQIALLALYLRVDYEHSLPNKIARFYIVGFGLAGMCWLISLFFNSPIKFILWILGMIIYLIIPWIGRKGILSKAPLDTVYIPERFGAFTIIILGQIIASVVFGLGFSSVSYYSMIASIMAFILAVLIFLQYYRFTQVADYSCTLRTGQPYIYAHIPLIIGLIIMGVCSENFIINAVQVNKEVNIIFCFATILYLTSFYMLQRIAIRKIKIRTISLICGIIALLFLFFFHPLPAVLTLSGVVIIFMSLFGVQYWISR
jgi:low temperature requirement protein LtrA